MIFFLIPVYNEESNLDNLWRELTAWAVHGEVHYVFYNDGSTDGSVNKISELFAKTNFTLLGESANHGPGVAFNKGFEWIIKNGSPNDTVVTLEADCTSDLGILSVMLALNGLEYDLVLASVYAQGGGFDRTSFFRKFVSATANFLFRFLFDVKVLTLSSFYRVYSVKLLARIQEQYGTLVSESGFVCMLEILVRAIHCNARIIEVPMQLHSSKRVGPSKMKILLTTGRYFRFLLKGTAPK